MTTRFPPRLIARLILLFFLGFCIVLWPLAGYAATFFEREVESGVEAVDQPSLALTVTAEPSQVAAGGTITYAYTFTDTGGGQIVYVFADDTLLGPIQVSGYMGIGLSMTVYRTYTVPVDITPGPLVSSVILTATAEDEQIGTATDTVTVTVLAPTALPEEEQPKQFSRYLFLPTILP